MKITVDAPDFEWMAKQVANPKSIMQSYRRHRRAEVQRLMSQGQDPYGQSYQPLSKAYAAKKRERWGNQPILTASGKMRRSYKTRLVGSVLEESMDPPAIYHQEGDGVPERLVLPTAARGIPSRDLEQLDKIGRRFIKRIALKAPRRTFTVGQTVL